MAKDAEKKAADGGRGLKRRWEVDRTVLENTLVGTLMGTLVGVVLRSYFTALATARLDWVIFTMVGLGIGLLSGFERTKIENLARKKEQLTEKLRGGEKKLITTAERYKNLFEGANDIIFTLDADHRFAEINTKFEEILDRDIEQWRGRSFFDLFAGLSREEAGKCYVATLGGEQCRFELDAIHGDGHVVPLSITFSPLRDSEGEITGVVGIARDASESKRIQELQSKFISHVSHEFLTPLATIKEFVSLLLDQVPGPINDRQKENLNRVSSNLRRLNRIVDNVLLALQSEEKRIVLHKEMTDVRQLILQARDDFQATADKKKVKLELALPAEPVRVYIDPDRILQVLTNLIGNSLKFTPEGREVVVGMDSGDDVLEVWVRDTGIGISKADQESIFESFQQVPYEHKFGRKGAGLGLSISREIVELHRGKFRVESELGRGSKFIFTLPLVQAPKILLVDDDPDLVDTFRDFLDPNRFQVCCAYDGKEALSKAIKELPDLIVLDIVMPKMNGYEVIGRLKENRLTCHIPIVILTGYSLDEELLTSLDSRVWPTLFKPVGLQDFLRTVNETLEKARS